MTDKIFFFTEYSKLKSTQGINHNFGPISSLEYQCTSIHRPQNVNEELNAISVYKGSVRYQYQNDDENSLSINIILKPEGLNFFDIPIKYFVYRNILKSSVLDGDYVKQDIGIHSVINNNLQSQALQPQKNHLGLQFRRTSSNPDYLRSDEDTFDSIFYDDTQYAAVKVEAGISLGKFSGVSFGFEIILDGPMFDPTLNLIRNINIIGGNRIDLTSTPLIARQIIKEKILLYLDPCAFYGLCFEKGVNVEENIELKGSALFTNILSKFTNQNRVYIDIRNENNLSLNYYDNYGNGKIRRRCDKLYQDNLSTSDEVNFGNSYNWPIHIIEKLSSFTSNNYNKQTIPIRIELPTGLGGLAPNTFQLLYLSAALTVKTHKTKTGQLLNKTGLFNNLPERKSSRRKFINLKNSDNSIWTNQLLLATYNEGASYNPVCTYSKIMYIRQYAEQPSQITKVVNTNHHFDNLFVVKPLNQYVKWTDASITQWWISGNEKYIEHKYNNTTRYSGIVKTGVGIDESRIIFFGNLVLEKDLVVERRKFPITNGNHPANGSFFKSVFINSNDNSSDLEPVLHNFTTSIKTININQRVANGYVEESLIALCFTKNEYSQLIEPLLANFSISHPVYFKLSNIVTSNNLTAEIFLENYTSNLELIGYDLLGNIKVEPVMFQMPPSVPQPLNLYSTSDQLIYNTAAAGDSESLPLNTFSDFDIFDSNHNLADNIALKVALNDIKLYNPRAYYTLRGYIRNGVLSYMPSMKIENEQNYDENYDQNNGRMKIIPRQKRKFKIKICFKNSLEGDYNAETNMPDLLPVNLIEPSSTGISTTGIGFTNNNFINNPDLFRSYIDLYKEKPTEIEKLFQPILNLRDKNNRPFKQFPNGIPIEYATSLGFGQIKNDEPIKIEISRQELSGLPINRVQYRTLISDRDTRPKDHVFEVNNRWLNLVDWRGRDSQIDLPNLMNKKRLRLAEWIVHEFGHAIYGIENPLRKYVWYEIVSKVYKSRLMYPNIDPWDGLTFIDFYEYYGSGHIRGNGDGNLSSLMQSIFYDNIRSLIIEQLKALNEALLGEVISFYESEFYQIDTSLYNNLPLKGYNIHNLDRV